MWLTRIRGRDYRVRRVDPTSRFVALGASNLARLALVLLDAARDAAQGAVEAHAALGRGRSYGMPTRLLGRGLDGIDGCGLWPALAAAPPRPTFALVMDVGNDLLYGVEVERMLGWVASALQRLQAPTTRLAVVGLPMPTLRNLAPWRFRLVRSLLVPSCRLSLPQVLDRAERLHAGLGALAAAHGAMFHAPPAEWYGFDPVHVRRACWPAAARTWLGTGDDTSQPALDGALARLRFLFAAPATRSLFGRVHHAEQPQRRWTDGTTLSLW
jgi:hypothetical protein